MAQVNRSQEAQTSTRKEQPNERRIKKLSDFADEKVEEIHDGMPSPMALFTHALENKDDSGIKAIEKSSMASLLCNKLIDTITAMIDKGITTTTVEIGHGIYKDSKFTLVQFDTARASFNIELSGSPENMMDFNRHTPGLHHALLETFPEYKFRIEAVIGSEYQPSYKNREKTRVQKSKTT